jgi:hypothetical protein
LITQIIAMDRIPHQSGAFLELRRLGGTHGHRLVRAVASVLGRRSGAALPQLDCVKHGLHAHEQGELID